MISLEKQAVGSPFESEILRRRTFAIISHPDAGKTTITEKILYLGRVIREAGEVKGKAGTKAATSDWMTMERERGVSITSSVMQFDYEGLKVNLLDTPGHKDFSEDTYRTLIAADCAAMLIDAAKGVETQTRKLYEVCRLRKMPIFTFANKMDREGKDPFALIDDVENTLKMACYPVTWPLGMGDRFRGLYHRLKNRLYLYSKGSEVPEIVEVSGYSDPVIAERVGEELAGTLAHDMELLEIAIGPLDREAFLRGDISPMTFGSAKNVWGVDLFLDLFVSMAPPPMARNAGELSVDPMKPEFTGMIFKIQANMDKRHRDRVAFMRVCSGRFERGMKVYHVRQGREIRLAYANQFLAQDRETVDEAFAGDIVGVTDTGNFLIGDTVTEGSQFQFDRMPRFSPEMFARVSIKDPLKKKQLQKGLKQLAEEGTVQMLVDPLVGIQDPILGVVGQLQFDVMLFRLKDEYGLEVRLEVMNYSLARWPRKSDGTPYTGDLQGSNVRVYHDIYENPVILLEKEWDLRWLVEKNPDVVFATNA